MTDTTMRVAEAAVEMIDGIRKLAELARPGQLGDLVAVLDALSAESGPLDELMHLFGVTSPWLTYSNDDDLAYAADRVNDCGGITVQLCDGIRAAADVIRPLVG